MYVFTNAPMHVLDMVHDEFISRLHDNFKKLYGIEIANIRVESFKIMNAELADNISKQAIITAQVSECPCPRTTYTFSPPSPHRNCIYIYPQFSDRKQISKS